MKSKFIFALLGFLLCCVAKTASASSPDAGRGKSSQDLGEELLFDKLKDLGFDQSKLYSLEDDLDISKKNYTDKGREVILQQLEKELTQAVSSVGTGRSGGMAGATTLEFLHGFLTGLFDSIYDPEGYAATVDSMFASAAKEKEQVPQGRSNFGMKRKDLDIQNFSLPVPADDSSNTNSSIAELACLQDVDPGVCRAAIARWYFNYTDATCRPFNYGGCHGNTNRFLDAYDCYATCTGKIPCPTNPSKGCPVDKSPCENSTFACQAHLDAVCKIQPCTCKAVFIDGDGKPLNCSDLGDQTNLPKTGVDEQGQTNVAKIGDVDEQGQTNGTKTGDVDEQSQTNGTRTGDVDEQSQTNGTRTGDVDEQGQTNCTKTGYVDEQDEIHCPEDPAKICLLSASDCVHATCVNNTEVECRVLPCTCEVVFVDRDGLMVNCSDTSNNATKDGHSTDAAKRNCRNVAIGIVVFVLLVFLIAAFSVGIVRRCKKADSYSTFHDFPTSMSALAEKTKESYTGFVVKMNLKDS